MAENGTKGRVLFLVRYMLEHTDETHMISTEELIRLYEENGYKANRNTIRDDVSVLNAAGIEILGERVGNKKSYHIGSRLFELAELRMLVDAVSSSRFITMTKSETLIGKLLLLTNVENRSALTAKIFTADRIKTNNTAVFYNIDSICKAIENGKKIGFHYWKYTPEKDRRLRHGGDLFVVSPYALIWDDDRYYLVARADYSQKIKTYRIDRMCDVTVTGNNAVPDESFNVSEYIKSTVRMYDGDLGETDVTLICDNPFMQNVVDKFGEEIETSVIDESCFQAIVTVRPSKTFFSWVVGFCGGIRIDGPSEVRARYEDTLRDTLERQAELPVK